MNCNRTLSPATSSFSSTWQKSAQPSENKHFQLPFFSHSCALFLWKSFAFYSLHFCDGGYISPAPTPNLKLHFNYRHQLRRSLTPSVVYLPTSSRTSEAHSRPTAEQAALSSLA